MDSDTLIAALDAVQDDAIRTSNASMNDDTITRELLIAEFARRLADKLRL